jgi:4-hydroxybenzoate polyprenyltransferase
MLLKGTPFSWVPMAVGVPLLPVYGWLGATGGLPGVFLILVPMAATAGAALAVANAVVDTERDAAAGSGSIATLLGSRRASQLALVLQVVVAALALVTGAVLGTPLGWQIAAAVSSLVPVGGALFGAIVVVRGQAVAERELAWEAQAVGLGLLAVAWVSGLGASMADHLGG